MTRRSKSPPPGHGNDQASPVQLTSFRGNEPYHGTTAGWLVDLNYTSERVAVNGRFTYAGGKRNFLLDQLATGSDRFVPLHQQETFAAGTASRPVTTGDLVVSLMATARLTVVNNTSFRNTRIDGSSLLNVFDNASLSSNVLYFQFLGIQTISNATDLQYRFRNGLSAYAGYAYSRREIRSIEQTSIPGFANSTFAETGNQENHQQAATGGVNWLIAKPLRLRVQGEIGRNDNPFFPISERNYHAIDSRLQLRARTVQAAVGYKQFYNNNSISLTTYSSRSRNWFGNASWTLKHMLTLDANYTKLHVDTLGGLAFFAGTDPQDTRGQSYYVSNLHVGNATVHWNPVKRADLSLGYTITRDAGDSHASLHSANASADSAASLLYNVRAFPLSFESPYMKISVQLAKKLRWNFTYQYYAYHEDEHFFAVEENYRAHTGTASLLWAF